VKAPLEWLSEYCDVPESIDDLAYRLTMSGSEIEDVIRAGENWQDVVVGRVDSLERPKGSRTLHVAQLNLGSSTCIAVTAAPNIEVGQRVPLVRIGGVVPTGPDGEQFVLKPKPMMGITGEAMVLSARELGLSDEHSGILVLDEDVELGAQLSTVLGGAVLDIGVTANRPDEMSMVGIAREVAALSRTVLREPDTTIPDELDGPLVAPKVTVLDQDLCRRYTAVVIQGIRVGESPSWMRKRLEAAGVRGINNVVDVANYVMLELGQPLHAFDLEALSGQEIIVRRAKEEEQLVTLDGSTRTMAEGALVICDAHQPVAIAGVMGGQESEVQNSTTAILLESAHFDRVSIRKTSRTLGLRSEASGRFERGVAPELTTIAAQRFVRLLASMTPGQLAVSPLTDVVSSVAAPAAIQVCSADIERLLGFTVSSEDTLDSLSRLGFHVEIRDDDFQITPPYWRRDVEGTADIAEEIARMVGYDRIPERLPGQQTFPVPLPSDLQWERVIRDALWGIGLSEAWADTLTSRESLVRLQQPEHAGWDSIVVNPEGIRDRGATTEPLALINPPSEERSVLRTTLVGSALEVLGRNLKHTNEDVGFFELARTFLPRSDDLPYERRTLAIGMAGLSQPLTWHAGPRPYDFFMCKGAVEEATRQLGIDPTILEFDPTGAGSMFHPGRSAILRVDGTIAGHLGEVHPYVAERFEIERPQRAYVAELDLDVLFARATSERRSKTNSRYPSVRRDISVIVGTAVSAQAVVHRAVATGGELLQSARVVDVYEGATIGVALKSLTLALEFQSHTETLTQEQVSTVQDEIVGALSREFGAQLRS
jgi:phenylalanyl-tRNA synthetase beta chain